MDCEQKYKEALERAKIIYTDKYKPEVAAFCKQTLESIFPELKELEDERIRKHLISLVKNWDKDGIVSKYTSNPKEIKQILAWLEKQGEKKPTWTDNDRTMAFTLLRDVDQMTYVSNEGKNERFEWLNSLEDKFNNKE